MELDQDDQDEGGGGPSVGDTDVMTRDDSDEEDSAEGTTTSDSRPEEGWSSFARHRGLDAYCSDSRR